ncbi:glycosyltransferase [Okeania sp. SIO2B3]|uniref:glycosyltransferase family 2 protein n=1 Tax=Okeania sp. SIO2B3 TaxID=2607784 RepID=UPI0013BFFFC1|nr:glycosyltransferase [Okeania sp. SIO2B3]NET43627.1 glycosyltransferase [Okeania sp. SIO2B3]
MPRVSVIIPVYNSLYVTEALDSVLNQTYRDYEIIVVDDGSREHIQQVLELYSSNINYIYQENQGVAAARNRGIEIAQGEFVAFLDHDDFFLPDKLALQVSCFDAQPQVGMVHTGWRRVNQKGEYIQDVKPWHRIPVLDLENWVRWMPILFSAMMFRRKWLEEVGGLDTGFKQASDLDLVQRLALIGCETVWVQEVTVCYREHSGNDSLNTPLQALESWQVRDKFFTRSDLPVGVHCLEKECRYRTLVWVAWRLYYTGYLEEMVEYLEKSLIYSPYSLTKTVSDWVKTFTKYSAEFGYELDALSLTQSKPWQQMISYFGRF